MSLDDEIRQRKAELQREEDLERAWKESPFSWDSPVVEQPPREFADLIREILPRLKFEQSYYRGLSPKGEECVAHNKAVEEWVGMFRRRREIRYSVNTTGEQIFIVEENGKLADLHYAESVPTMIVFPDGAIAKTDWSPSIRELRRYYDWNTRRSPYSRRRIKSSILTHFAKKY